MSIVWRGVVWFVVTLAITLAIAGVLMLFR